MNLDELKDHSAVCDSLSDNVTSITGDEFTLPDRSNKWYQDKTNYLPVLKDAIKHGEYDTEVAIEYISKCGMTKTLLRAAVSKLRKERTNTGWHDVDMKGNPKPTSNNLVVLLKRHDIKLSINAMSHDLEVSGASFNDSSVEDGIITHLEDLAVQHNMPYLRIKSMVKHIAYRNVYHPFDEYLNTLPAWDGVDRIRGLLKTLTLGDESDTYFDDSLMMFKKWLLQFVAAVRRKQSDPPIRLTLILTGKQHIGKTTYFRKIPPDESLFYEGIDLNPGDKDSVSKATKYLLTELGEIDATFSKKEVSLLKAFLSRSVDEMRMPYDRGTTKNQRRTVFCGTVNEPEFLVDQTGNTRFAVVDVNAIDWKAGNAIDRIQLWAQVLHLFNTGVTWSLNKDELEILNARNECHTETPYACMLVNERFMWQTEKRHWQWLGITDIANELGFESAVISNTKAQKELKSALMKCTEQKKDTELRKTVYLVPKTTQPRR